MPNDKEGVTYDTLFSLMLKHCRYEGVNVDTLHKKGGFLKPYHFTIQQSHVISLPWERGGHPRSVPIIPSPKSRPVRQVELDRKVKI